MGLPSLNSFIQSDQADAAAWSAASDISTASMNVVGSNGAGKNIMEDKYQALATEYSQFRISFFSINQEILDIQRELAKLAERVGVISQYMGELKKSINM